MLIDSFSTSMNLSRMMPNMSSPSEMAHSCTSDRTFDAMLWSGRAKKLFAFKKWIIQSSEKFHFIIKFSVLFYEAPWNKNFDCEKLNVKTRKSRVRGFNDICFDILHVAIQIRTRAANRASIAKLSSLSIRVNCVLKVDGRQGRTENKFLCKIRWHVVFYRGPRADLLILINHNHNHHSQSGAEH